MPNCTGAFEFGSLAGLLVGAFVGLGLGLALEDIYDVVKFRDRRRERDTKGRFTKKG